MNIIEKIFGTHSENELKRIYPIVDRIEALGPEMDTFARMPAAELVAVHMDPPEPSPAVSDHAVSVAAASNFKWRDCMS